MTSAILRAFFFATLAAGPATPALADLDTAPAAEAEEEYEFGVLFDAPGVEETYYTCIACHSERIVAQQGLTRDRWDDVLVWMVEEQGMYEIDEPDRSAILDYLATYYNEDRPNFPGHLPSRRVFGLR